MESRMLADWQELANFMRDAGVHAEVIQGTAGFHSHAMDAALDSLLSSGSEFLRRAAAFQHVLSLAQPVRTIPAHQQKQFETVMRLAHRVQSLTPGNFSNYLVKNFGDHRAESFFLRDAAPEEDDLFFDESGEQITYYSMQGVALRTEYI